MSTRPVWFQYHTTAVGNKNASIFLIGCRILFGGIDRRASGAVDRVMASASPPDLIRTIRA
jgi:hypothetical protein